MWLVPTYLYNEEIITECTMIWMRNFSTSFLSNFAIVILKIYEYAENAFMTFKIVSKIMIGYWIPNPMLLFVLFCTSLFQINIPTRQFILNSPQNLCAKTFQISCITDRLLTRRDFQDPTNLFCIWNAYLWLSLRDF